MARTAHGGTSSTALWLLASSARFSPLRSQPIRCSATYSIARLAAEVVVFLLWVASAALMLRPRGECYSKGPIQDGPLKGVIACANNDREGNEWKWRYDSQPIKTWDVAIAVSLIEA
ncbi:MAG: hypothetical protein Q9222_006176 [Ikaeria aurantiellina]